MIRGGIFWFIALLAVPSWAAAETMSFGDAAAMMAKGCGADIVAYCRGVNLDGNRLKECLSRNQDVTSPQCKATYLQALDAIQKRIAARFTHVRNQHTHKKEHRHRRPHGPTVSLRSGHAPQRVSQACGDRED